jgi:hypothetical protein
VLLRLSSVQRCCFVKIKHLAPDIKTIVHLHFMRAYEERRYSSTRFQTRWQKLQKATVSFRMSAIRPFIRPFAWNKPVPTERIFMKFDM